MPVSTVIMQAILQSAQHQGLIPYGFARAAQAELTRFGDPAEMVPDWRVGSILSGLVMANHEQPGLGLKVGSMVDVGSLHLLGVACATRRTARDALAALERIGTRMLGMPSFTLVEARHEARLVLQDLGSGPSGRFLAEFCVAYACNIVRPYVALLPWAATRIEMRHSLADAGPGVHGVHHHLLWDREEDGIVFSRHVLDVPIPGTSSSAAHRIELLMDEMILRARHRSALKDRVRRALRGHPELAHVDLEALASQFGVRLASLRRRLKAEGTSLGELVDEARVDRAMIELDSRSIAETARRMGYSEPSAFHRAFKRFTGKTPGQYRRSVRAHGPLRDDTDGETRPRDDYSAARSATH